jgi:hypothetical protein
MPAKPTRGQWSLVCQLGDKGQGVRRVERMALSVVSPDTTAPFAVTTEKV